MIVFLKWYWATVLQAFWSGKIIPGLKKKKTAAMDRSHVLTWKKLNSLSCVFKITSQLELIAKIFQSLWMSANSFRYWTVVWRTTHCSSHVTAAENRSPPMPPCSSGVITPSRPCSPAFSHTSLLTWPAFSHLQQKTVEVKLLKAYFNNSW